MWRVFPQFLKGSFIGGERILKDVPPTATKKKKRNEEPHAAILVKPVTLNTEQQNHNFKPMSPVARRRKDTD